MKITINRSLEQTPQESLQLKGKITETDWLRIARLQATLDKQLSSPFEDLKRFKHLDQTQISFTK